MKKTLLSSLFLLFAGLMTFTVTAQETISGVKIGSTLKAESDALVLRGAGVRKKYFISVYVASLYTKSSKTSANTILSGNEPVAIKLSLVTSLIDGNKMVSATKDGFEKSTQGKTEPIKNEMAQLFGYLRQGLTKGDECVFYYNPKNMETALYVNNKKLGGMKGKYFMKAFFGIYVSANTVDSGLKSKLLR